MASKAIIKIQEVSFRKKLKPRGKPFEKGNKMSAESGIKKGEKRNPKGLNQWGNGATLISEATRQHLQRKVPDEVAELLGCEPGITFAEALSISASLHAINGNIPALKEMREITEGKTPETIYLSGGKDKDGETLPVATTTTLNIMFVDPPSKNELETK